MQRRKFSREYKLEAVRMVKERGVSVAQAARDLDVHENVLRKWVREQSGDPVQSFPGHGNMEPEQLEIERLRREVAKLKAERDILKKPQPTLQGMRFNLRLHCKAPLDLAGGMALRSAGRFPIRVPRVAQSLSKRALPDGYRPAGQDQSELSVQ